MVLKMADKHIELFPGSLEDLEDMTGKEYKAMRKNGNLLSIHTRITQRNPGVYKGAITISSYPLTKVDADAELEVLARRFGADALVHVTYIAENLVIPNRTVFISIAAFGYAVREINTKEERDPVVLEAELLGLDEAQPIASNVIPTYRHGPKRSENRPLADRKDDGKLDSDKYDPYCRNLRKLRVIRDKSKSDLDVL